ncbi:MAG TPA: EF-Tu/IF-2/RF-3 family GTPase, partial [Alphaproteobacteria bacterium]|nr:EF-Tu/IF-2/RF-3 family GTPase [Alphaproteobacteria bacterium]
STPVEVLGLQGTPMAGNQFVVVESENKAREVSETRQRKSREMQVAAALGKRGNIEQMLSKAADSNLRELAVILKSDVQGSLEALSNSLNKLNTNEVAVRILHAAVGGINESDVTLARASGAIIVGFNVRANPLAREIARRDAIDIKYYSIIYNVIDDVKAILGGLLAPTLQEKFLGYAEIREVFSVPSFGKVAGCMVTEGIVKRGAKVRLLRDNVVIYQGNLQSLRRFKDEVREVKEGYECGMAFDNYQDISKSDVVECYEIEQIARTLAS